ncbi:MAG TPA: VOC family protein [Candidatus Thermoplasmatota archaeon]|nr:VOC family protein [Candidatus Thermoplasmatota archaeon]
MKVVLGDVAVVVRDAKESAKWWKRLGFEVRDGSGHWITVATPGSDVVLHLCADEAPAESGNTGIGFFVDDLRALHKAWTKKGVRFTKEPVQEVASFNAMFADPDGNEYWLFEDEDLRPRKPVKRAKKAPAKKRAAKKSAKKASRRRS